MKSIANLDIKVDGDNITITGKIVDRFFGFPAQQQTVPYQDMKNARWMRHIQISNEGTFVKAFGNGFGLAHADLVAIATKVEPKTSYPPLFKKKLDNDLVAEISSDIEPDLQWQESDSTAQSAIWTDIVGATTKALDKTKATKKFVRLVAKSESGEMISNPVQL